MHSVYFRKETLMCGIYHHQWWAQRIKGWFMVKSTLFFLALLTSFSIYSDEVFDDVTVYELHNFPERYLGKLVAVEGYFVYLNGKVFVYPSKDSAMVDFRAQKKLVLFKRNEIDDYKPCLNGYGVLVARFGYLKEIFDEMEVILDPQRMIKYLTDSDPVNFKVCRTSQ